MSSGAYGTGRLRNVPVANVVPSSLARRIASQAATRAVRRENLMSSRRFAFAAPLRRGPRLTVQEKKYFDTTLSFLFDATGEVPATGQLALIPQGDTAVTRDGRECIIKSIQIRGNMTFTPAAAATAAGNTHLWLILDTQCNKAAAAVTDVFTGTAMPVALLNLDNSNRFRIIKHWVHTWTSQAGVTTAYNDQSKTFEYFKRCNIKMTYNSTAGAITEITQNNLFLIAGSSANIDDLVTMAGVCRLRFVG